MTVMARHPSEASTDEEALVYLNRFNEARRYGLTRLEARLFAESELDIGQLRRLQRLGCPPALAAKVLL